MIDFCAVWIGPYAFWYSLSPEVKAAIIGAVSTILVGAIGFGGLFIQVRTQGKQSRDAIAENERRRLKAAMYEDAVAICREVADISIELSNALRMMMFQLQYAAQAHAQAQPFDLPVARFPILLKMNSDFSDAVQKFIFLVENRRVVDPRILIFRTAMSVVLRDTRDLMTLKFVQNVMASIPRQMSDGTIFPYTPPTVEHAAVIKGLCEQFIDSLGDAMMFTEDFMVELQNHLLGDLFGKVVAHRTPLDPQKKVITLEHSEELERWFATSTAWGEENAQIEAETAAQYAPPPTT